MADESFIAQTWVHIVDLDFRNKHKQFRYVFDLYTKVDFFCYDFKNLNFANASVRARNLNTELAYVVIDGMMRISLGPLDRWPKVPDSNCNDNINWEYKDFFHIKLEIIFTPIDSYFNINKFDLGYNSIVSIPYDKIQPEFHLNVPKGLLLKENSLNFNIFYDDKSYENKKDQNRFKSFAHNEIFYLYDKQSHNYSIILKNKHYNDFLKKDIQLTDIILSYDVKHDGDYFIIPVFATISCVLALIGLLYLNTVEIPFVALISLMVFYFALIHEGYEIPLKKTTFCLIVISIILVILLAFKELIIAIF
ncbi:MAG: hypothetical protein LBM96_03335 [Methanobrevibacter sp.]|nr:hypothetical protein [Candidatus Methanoflexus mossambicus]